MRGFVLLLVAMASMAFGMWLGGTELGQVAREQASVASERAVGSALGAIAERTNADMRMRVIMENPSIIQRIRENGGGFGGEMSQVIALNMFGRTEDAIAEARELTKIIELAPRTWLVRFPVVNAVLFETDEGMVVVDTGMGPAGPALVDAIREVSDAPLHTVIYTHGHVDHAYGTWALEEAFGDFEVVAHRAIEARFDRYIRLRGSIARYMSQKEEQMPASRDDLVWPTQLFDDRLELEIGGETFVLQHHRGETDDQLYVWVPGRKALASADYYQGFLPNAGNGKRVQRHPEEWAVALREMAALGAEMLLPAHGAEITDPAEIAENFTVLADALQTIVDQTIAGLNSGLRQDQVWTTVELPPHLRDHPTLNVQYVSVQDISKMVIRQYTGWWNDQPAQWSPAPVEAQAQEIIGLSGGVDVVAQRARELIGSDLELASHLADWAFFANPDDATAQQLVLDVYKARILDEEANVQEILAYIDMLALARERQLAGGS